MKTQNAQYGPLLIVIGLMTVLAGCGRPAAYSNNTPPTDASPGFIGTSSVPEAHGSMTFHDATQQEAQQPASTTLTGVSSVPNAADSTAGTNDGSNLQNGTLPARHNLCQDGYDATKQMPEGLVCPRCERGQFTQPGIAQKKLDILFMADTSPSLADTRNSIARSVTQFVSALPEGTDYRIAVIPAHSDKSYDDKVKPSTHLGGKIYARSGEPLVLTKNNFNLLESRITHLPSDAPSDGGELGLYSLNLAISEPLLSQNRKAGFFRPDAALAVIFMSDENDLCSYDVNYPPGVLPNNKDPDMYSGPITGGKRVTVEIAANKFYCKGGGDTPVVTDKTVYAKLRQLMQMDGDSKQARPLLISGVVYTDVSTVPTAMPADEPYPQYFFEKEKGYGYLDLIKDNNGFATDIGKANYDDGLRQIGEAAAAKLQVKSEFQLKDGVAVDPNSLCVMVNGKEATEIDNFSTPMAGFSYTYNKGVRELQLRGVGATNADGSPSKVDIFYCEPPSVTNINPELFSREDLPTIAEHYRNIPVPSACRNLKAKISSGALDNG